MNYRHIYHAGNFADVFKHLLLSRALGYLNKKQKPYFMLDTHGGIGRYDLTEEQANKTGEYEQGISQLFRDSDAPEFTDDYLQAIRQLNETDEVRYYPGSPWLCGSLMRAQDRLIVCELHSQDGETLKHNIASAESECSVQVLAPQNGYQAVSALLPPPEKRGLVLIDPPFEQLDEFDQVVTALTKGLKRWQTGSYAVWYPIKDTVKIAAFHRDVAAINDIPKTLVIELMIRSTDGGKGLHGCGFVWVNPPFGLVNELDQLLAYLRDQLAQSAGAESHYRWLVEEG